MSHKTKQLLWFTGIYVGSLLTFALVSFLIRAALRVL
jgi:hypothetical protein